MIVAGFTLIGPMQVAGRILLVTLGRRLSMGGVGSLVILAYPIVIAILMLPPSAVTLFSFATIYGLANGTLTIIRGVIVADYYGQRAYGAINGAITMPTSMARAAAPFLAALIWHSGGYTPVLWALLVVALVSALCFWSPSPSNGGASGRSTRDREAEGRAGRSVGHQVICAMGEHEIAHDGPGRDPSRRAVPLRAKGWNRRARMSSGTPGPSSMTSTIVPPCHLSARTVTHWAPASKALRPRLNRMRNSSERSARIW